MLDYNGSNIELKQTVFNLDKENLDYNLNIYKKMMETQLKHFYEKGILEQDLSVPFDFKMCKKF